MLGIKTNAQIFFLICCISIGIALTSCVTQNIKQNQKIDLPDADSLSLQSQLLDSTILTLTDSSIVQNLQDSIIADSLSLQSQLSDSIVSKDTLPLSPNAVTSIVDYTAQDSVEFDIKNRKAILHQNTELLYEDVDLKSNYAEIDFSKNELFSKGTTGFDEDSSETLQGTPVFKQGEYEVKSHELFYNFNSKKGLLRNVITQEGESFLHGKIVKKNADNSSFIRHGKYTTCNLECPHFEINFGKAKVIPNDKIVTGPLYLRIAQIPTFIALPFGFFPNSSKHTNGLIIPSFPYDPNLGFCFKGVGYYFAIKDFMDYAIKADIYMRGAFGIGIESNYVKRYKFNGRYELFYKFTPMGEPTINRVIAHDFIFRWNHQQDRKAHPTVNFSANVDFQTSGIRKNTIAPDFNTFTRSTSASSVSFSTSFRSRYSLGVNANITQNLISGDLSLDLPQINFSISEFYPLRRRKVSGKLRWYEEISMQYSVDMNNGISTTDSILFNSPLQALNTFRSTLNQYIPIKSRITLFKHLKWNNSVSFREIWNIRAVNQSWERDTANPVLGRINRDTVFGFFASHDLAYNSDLSTTLYGMFIMKKGKVYAFRHTFMPSVGFTYRPGINKMNYSTYYDSIAGAERRYSIINAPPYHSSASINFAINNRLEAKVRTKIKNEEDEEFKNIVILESFSIRTSYDFMKDSLNLEPISINGRTTLFKYINLGFSLRLDPYAYDDSLGVRTNTFEWKKNRRLFRVSSTVWEVSCGLNINKDFFKSEKRKTENREEVTMNGFKDWNISLNYTFNYNMSDNEEFYRYLKINPNPLKYTHTFTNTLNIGGRVAITPKWALDFYSGYDFNLKQISVSEFTVERDLHCWLMKFTVRPFGTLRGFEFFISAKANILQDAKWEHKKPLDEY